MSFLNKLKDGFNSSRSELVKQVARFKNKKFMQGTVAVCARIAIASNGVSTDEKQKMLGFLQASDELKVFATSEVIEFFNKLMASFEFDTEVGKGETMKYILAMKDQPEAAQLAIRVGIAVAKSDGDFDEDEQKTVREIATALGFQPTEFNL